MNAHDLMTVVRRDADRLQLLEPEQVYAGGINRPLALVELKLPDIGLAGPDARAGIMAAAAQG